MCYNKHIVRKQNEQTNSTTAEDKMTQQTLDNKKATIAKAKAAGLTDEDLKALGVE